MTRAQLKSFRSVSPSHFACTATTPAPHATGTPAERRPPWGWPCNRALAAAPADLPRAPRGITVVGGAPAVGAASGWRSPLGRWRGSPGSALRGPGGAAPEVGGRLGLGQRPRWAAVPWTRAAAEGRAAHRHVHLRGARRE